MRRKRQRLWRKAVLNHGRRLKSCWSVGAPADSGQPRQEGGPKLRDLFQTTCYDARTTVFPH